MAELFRVRMTIEVEATTDREPFEWGDAIARGLRADMNGEFGPVEVECVDWEYVSAVSPTEEQ